MFLIVDLSILLIIGLCIFLGYKRGLIGVAFKLISFIVALIVATTLSAPISNAIINNTEVTNNISKAIETKFIEEGNLEDENQGVQIEVQNDISSSLLNIVGDSINEAKTQGVKVIARSLAEVIVRAVVAIGLYMATKFVLFFFRKIAEVIAELPIIKQFNKAGRTSVWNFKRFLSSIYCARNNFIVISNDWRFRNIYCY